MEIVSSSNKPTSEKHVHEKYTSSYPTFISQSWGLQEYTYFLSHLLIAGCDIGVQISVRSLVRWFARPSVNIYIEV